MIILQSPCQETMVQIFHLGLQQVCLQRYDIYSKISRIFRFLDHNLEFLKMLKGENFTPALISLYTPVRVIISREKKFFREFWVLPFTAGL